MCRKQSAHLIPGEAQQPRQGSRAPRGTRETAPRRPGSPQIPPPAKSEKENNPPTHPPNASPPPFLPQRMRTRTFPSGAQQTRSGSRSRKKAEIRGSETRTLLDYEINPKRKGCGPLIGREGVTRLLSKWPGVNKGFESRGGSDGRMFC